MKAEDRIYELFAEADPAPPSLVSTIDRPEAEALVRDHRRPRVLTEKTPGTLRPATYRPRRSRGLAVAAAGSVAVIAVIGVTVWLGSSGDEPLDVATDPPVATEPPVAPTVAPTEPTQPPTPTTSPPVVIPGVVSVPDLIGLSLGDARVLVSGLGLEIEANPPAADTALIVAQDPGAGTELGEGSAVVVDARVAPTCAPTVSGEPQSGQMAITVLFECGNDGLFPTGGIALQRLVPEGGGEAIDRIEWTLRNLLFGPSEEERIAGFTSFFDSDTAGALISVTLSEGHVVADFADTILVNNASTSTGSVFFNAELRANLFQHPEVDSVELRLNGDCEAWSAFFQGDGCWVVTRAEWTAQVAEWDAQRDQ
jgi:hypothetical protein